MTDMDFYRLRDQPGLTPLSQVEVDLTIRLAEAVRMAGGRALVVGGYPRDLVIKAVSGKRVESKDIDLEVYGLEADVLQDLATTIHHVNAVGASFGVLKVGPLDVALPRRDSKDGSGHRGFVVEADPHMGHAEAARRRDFTINTLALDPLTGELLDEHGGVEDISRGLLRMVDPETFGDDALRGLRAIQFAARFGFAVEPQTAEAVRQLEMHELSSERIGEEWHKLLTKSEKPGIGLELALELGIIHKLHPELAALVDTPQEPEWHPEGSVWNHTVLAVNVAAMIVRRERIVTEYGKDAALTVMLGALCHDLGKPLTTALDPESGRIRSHEHAKVGVPLARDFMRRLHVPAKIARKVERIVFDHMFLPEVRHAKDAAIRRLAKRLQPATVQELIWVTEADFCGRTLVAPDMSLVGLFKQRAEELAVAEAPMEPLVLGRDLLDLGVVPGRKMGDILKQLEAAQTNGMFDTREGGIAYYREHIAKDANA